MITYKVKEIKSNKLTNTELKKIINTKIYKIIELLEFN